jgi:hypothetical protein
VGFPSPATSVLGMTHGALVIFDPKMYLIYVKRLAVNLGKTLGTMRTMERLDSFMIQHVFFKSGMFGKYISTLKTGKTCLPWLNFFLNTFGIRRELHDKIRISIRFQFVFINFFVKFKMYI